MQGGIDPQLPVTFYADLVRAVRAAVPGMHVHAFSPMEIVSAAAKAGVSIEEWLTELRDAGLGSIPGTAAEILDDEVRWVLTKGKLPAAQWVEVVSTAHRLGIPSSSTMMYGHVDEPRHWLGHLRTLAAVQDETGGFTEFVPLPFVHHNAPIYLAGLARPGPTERDNRAVHAFARLALHGRIDHVQVSWVKLGDALAADVLRGGADDMGGTLMEETISRMAGSENGSARTVTELTAIAAAAGRPVRQRSTTYREPVARLEPAVAARPAPAAAHLGLTRAPARRSVAGMGVLGEMFPSRKLRSEAGEAGNGQGWRLGPIDLDAGVVEVHRDEPDEDDDPTPTARRRPSRRRSRAWTSGRSSDLPRAARTSGRGGTRGNRLAGGGTMEA